MSKDSISKYLNRISQLEQENKRLREKLSTEISRNEVAEQKFITSELNLLNLIEAIPVPVFFKSKNGVYIGCNDAFAKFEELPKEKILGSSQFEIFPKGKTKEYADHDKEVLDKKKTIIRKKTITINNKVRHVEIHKSVFKDIITNDQGIVGIIIDNTERINYENAIKESERKLRSFINQSYEGIIIIDRKGTILEWNKAIETLTGIQTDEALNKKFIDFAREIFPLYHDTEKFEKFKSQIQLLLNSSDAYLFNKLFDTQLKHRNGNIYDIQQLLFPIHLKDDYLIASVTVDITDKKKAERKIREKEEFFRRIAETIIDMISISDSKGKYTYIGPSFEKYLGYSLNDLKGKTLFDFIHPGDKNAMIELFQQKISTKKNGTAEYRFKHKNGQYIWLETTGKGVLNENGDIDHIFYTSRDITERKTNRINLSFLANSALQFLSLTKKDKIFEYLGTQISSIKPSSYVAICSFDFARDIIKVENIHGFRRYLKNMVNMLGTNPVGIEFPISNINLNLTESKIHKIHIPDYEYNFPALSKKTFLVLAKLFKINYIYYIPFRVENITYGTAVVLTKDILPDNILNTFETISHQASVALYRHNIEEKLKESKLKAEESDRLKSAFLANMSHEIRTPMNGVLGFSQLLIKGEQPREKTNRFLNIIYNNSKQLLNIINDIIDISKIESGQLTIYKSKTNINDICYDLVTFFESELEKTEKQDIDFKFIPTLDDQDSDIYCDGNRLYQVLVNLIGNAIKFTEHGYVKFGYTIDSDKKYIVFYITDSGIGISKDKIEVIFERFKQADDRINRKFGGTGLGLTISKQLAELMGGKLWVESEPGKGSTFSFSLPYISDNINSNIPTPLIDKVEKNYIKNKTILIVEDDYTSFLFIESLLEDLEATLIWVENGIAAIDMVKINPLINIVLMDIQIPGISGYETTKKIKELRPELPIIAQTANAMEGDMEKALKAGCNDYISKPINHLQLIKKINAALHN